MLLRAVTWVMMSTLLVLRYCLRSRPRLTTIIATLFLLNFYFILLLVRSKSRAAPPYNKLQPVKVPRGLSPKNHRGSNARHGFNLPQQSHNLNADRMMLGEDFTHFNLNDDTAQSALEKLSYHKFSDKCEILQPQGYSSFDSNVQTPFRIYIYDLPAALNTHLTQCVTKYKSASCFRGDYCGFGPVTGGETGITVHGTWQFNLEVLLHHVLLHSPYRTHDASKASVFYVPYYAAHACYCYSSEKTALEDNIRELQDFLLDSPFHRAGKPHLTTIGKIEREHYHSSCPLLVSLNTSLFRIIGIEEEVGVGVRRAVSNYKKPLIVAPYPSYGHLDNTINPDQNFYQNSIANRDRTVYLFLASGQRRSNKFRAAVFDNILSRPNAYRTRLSYTEFLFKQAAKDPNFNSYIEQQQGMIETAWLITTECQGDHHRYTLDWMQRSIFCLQPPGDSPTRKSFYDAIISGCIPVLFSQKYPVKYPFQRLFDYRKFTVRVPEEVVTRHNMPIATYLGRVSPSKIKDIQVALATVAQYLQYSYPVINGQPHTDATKYLLDEVWYVLDNNGW